MDRFPTVKRAVLWIASIITLLFAVFPAAAQQETFSSDRLESFYDTFVCEEKDAAAAAGITCSCVPSSSSSSVPPTDSCGAYTAQPTIPSLAAAASSTSLIPFVLVNNTGLANSEVYFVIYGRPVTGCTSAGPTLGNFSFVSFGAQPGPFTAVGTMGGSAQATGVNTPPSATYSYRFSDIPLTNGQRIIYIPHIESGIILYSISDNLDLTVGSNSIAIPVATYSSDPSYLTVYGGMELTFYPASCPTGSAQPLNQLTVDFTCVDYYGLSVYFNLFTQSPLAGLPQNRPSGIYQSRHHTLCELQNTLSQASAAARSQWTGLVLTSGSKILRVVSPGYSMSHTGGTFDTNYLDHASAYGFSWANDVWTGSRPYYSGHTIQVTTVDGTTFNGQIVSGNFVFQGKVGKDTQKFTIPWLTSGTTTSTAIFNVESTFPNMTYSLNGSTPCIIGSGGGCPASVTNATQITQYLSAAIAAGLIPGKVTKLVPAGFPPSVINSYYTPNANLNTPGPTTGPWFDLYSLGFFSNDALNGNAVYTYAYDDYLYNLDTSIKVAPSQLTIDSSTYITIVLGPYTDN
jgi:hypothetical protein